MVIKLGAPDPTRDTHAPYKGAWASFSSKCPVCYGTGKERFKHNPMAGLSIHFDVNGVRQTPRQLPMKGYTHERADDDE